MKLLALIFIFAISHSVAADGVMQLSGKVKSFSPSEIEISDGHKIYTIMRSKLSYADIDKLKKVKAGMAVRLEVPFSAFYAVR